MSAIAAAAAPASYTIQGRTVTCPVVVRDAVAVVATFAVSAGASRG